MQGDWAGVPVRRSGPDLLADLLVCRRGVGDFRERPDQQVDELLARPDQLEHRIEVLIVNSEVEVGVVQSDDENLELFVRGEVASEDTTHGRLLVNGQVFPAVTTT